MVDGGWGLNSSPVCDLPSTVCSCYAANMDEPSVFSRSPELMSAADTALLVVDVQERLIGSIRRHERIVWNIRRLIDGAKLLGLPVVATEQYPAGLGPTVPESAQPGRHRVEADLQLHRLPGAVCRADPARGHKSCRCAGSGPRVRAADRVGLLAAGWRVYVAVDAVGSRFAVDARTALRRMDSAGASLVTTEAALFEMVPVGRAPAIPRDQPVGPRAPARRARNVERNSFRSEAE